MRLRVLSRFSTVLVVRSNLVRMVGTPGQMIEVDEETGCALLRDVGPCLTLDEPEAETVSEAPVVEMAPVPEEIAVPARTRQVVKVRQPKPRSKR